MSHAYAFDHHTHIQACAQGRSQALHALFQHEAPSMLALAEAWLAEEAQARQVVVDTFVMVWKHASHYPAKAGQARAWLYSILRHRLKYEPHDYERPDPVRWHSLPELNNDVLVGLAPADKRVLQAAYCLGLNAQALTQLAPQGGPADLRQALATLVQIHGMATPTLAAVDQQALAAYVLGASDEAARSRAEGLLQSQPAAAQHVLHWEGVCLVFVDALAPAPAAQPLLATICRQLQLPAPAPAPIKPTPIGRTAAPDNRTQAEAPTPLLRVPSNNTPASQAAEEEAPRAPAPVRTTPAQATAAPIKAPAAEPAKAAPPAAEPIKASAAASVADAQAASPSLAQTHAESIPAEDERTEARKRTRARTAPQASTRKSFKQRPALLPWFGGIAVVLALGFAASQWLGAAAQPNTPVEPPRPRIQHVAILQAPGSTSTPGWLLTQDTSQQLNLKPLVNVELAPSEAVYLWTQADTDPAPRLISRVMPDAALRLTPEQIGPIRPGQVFEMTLEPIRETLPAEPEGAVLFIGRTVGLEEAPTSTQAGPVSPPATRNP